VKIGGGTHRTSWSCSLVQWILRTEKPLQRFQFPRISSDVEGLNDAGTPLVDFFSILLDLGLPFLDSRAKARVG
jgi:hypothetical protein